VQTASVGRDPQERGSAPAADVDDPVVRYGNDEEWYSLPAAALFDTNEPRLRQEAEPLLTDLAVKLRTGEVVAVQVVGYADPRGDGIHNQTLSTERAEAVAAFLRDQGVPNVHAEGKGETTACIDGTRFPATATSDPETQCARRVDIVASRA